MSRSKSRHIPPAQPAPRAGRHVEWGVRPPFARRKETPFPVIRVAFPDGTTALLTGADVEKDDYAALDDWGADNDGEVIAGQL